MSGFGVAPEVWMGAGKGVGEVSDELADGVDAFCRAVGGGSRFGSDDLGRALFEGDARSRAPGFAGLRDGLLNDLAVAVNLLRGMGAGLVDAGGRYVEADGAIVDELGVQRRPIPSSGATAGLGEYRLPEVAGGLPSTVPAPGFVLQAQWFFETVGLGCPWPDGDSSGVEALRDAAATMGRVLDHVAEMVAGHARRVTGSGFGEATAAFGAAARVVHGEGGLLEDLKRRCEQLAAYCQSGAAAIVKARWHFAASAVFVLSLMYAASVFGPLLEAAVVPLIRLEGLALQITLRMIREAAVGTAFSGGLDAIDQLFRTGHVDLGELGRALWQGAVAGGLMGGAHAGLPALLRRGAALTRLANAMESPGWKGISSRFLVGGTVGTAAMATTGAASGNGWDLKHAAETGFGMAFISTGGETASAAGRFLRSLTGHHPPSGAVAAVPREAPGAVPAERERMVRNARAWAAGDLEAMHPDTTRATVPPHETPLAREPSEPPSPAQTEQANGTYTDHARAELSGRGAQPGPATVAADRPGGDAVIAEGRRLAAQLFIADRTEPVAETLGRVGRILDLDVTSGAHAQENVAAVRRLMRHVYVGGNFYECFVRVVNEAQRQGFQILEAPDRAALVTRLERFQAAEPLLGRGLWIADIAEIGNSDLATARALGRMDELIGSEEMMGGLARRDGLRELTYDVGVGHHSVEHLTRLFIDAQDRGFDPTGARDRPELVEILKRYQALDPHRWNGLRLAELHSVAADDTVARVLSRMEGMHGGLPELASEVGVPGSVRTLADLFSEAERRGSVAHARDGQELAEVLRRERALDPMRWDQSLIADRLLMDRLSDPVARALVRANRIMAVGSPATEHYRMGIDPLERLAHDLGLGYSPKRLGYAFDRAQRLGFDPAGAADRPALIERLGRYIESTRMWTRIQVAERYAIGPADPIAGALSRIDRIVGTGTTSPPWALDPIRRMADDLGLDHSAERVARMFRDAQQRGFDPAGATDRGALAGRLRRYDEHRSGGPPAGDGPVERPFPTGPESRAEQRTAAVLAREADRDLRQLAIHHARMGRELLRTSQSPIPLPDRSGTLVTGEAAREWLASLEARVRTWQRWPDRPEVSYRENVEAFHRDFADAIARAERGEPTIPYMYDNATGGLGARDDGLPFGREIEYDFPPEVMYRKNEINRAIARDLYVAGLAVDSAVHGYHTAEQAGYTDAPNAWRIEDEPTVAGEVVSPIMYDEPQTWINLKKVCEIIASHGGIPSNRTGGHITVGTYVFDHVVAHYNRTFEIVDSFFDTLTRLGQDPARGEHRGTRYCALNPHPSDGYESIATAHEHNHNHSIAVNLHVAGERGDRVEHRWPDGTLDPATIQTQIKLALGMTAKALRDGADGLLLNGGDHEPIGTHLWRRALGLQDGPGGREREMLSYLELTDGIYHRAVDKAQLTALLAATLWNRADL
jgi:hypothetical protein